MSTSEARVFLETDLKCTLKYKGVTRSVFNVRITGGTASLSRKVEEFLQEVEVISRSTRISDCQNACTMQKVIDALTKAAKNKVIAANSGVCMRGSYEVLYVDFTLEN